ncbi:MAG: NAD(P)/FAD-dependent oxidoreductase [Candidatus Diapherotrites archaeon]
MQYDLLIVGGGPCGLSAALSASKRGLQVLCIERKESPGYPVRCAEGIGKFLLPFLPYKIPKNIFRREIKGVHFWHDNFDIIQKGSYYEGFTIDRIDLEKWLCDCAIKSGAVILFGHEVISFFKNDNNYKVLAKVGGKEIFFNSKKILFCDGADSKFLQELDFKLDGTDLINVCSWKVNQIDLEEPDYEQVIFSKNFANGYGYIFPKTTSSANIGVGEVNCSLASLKKKLFSMIRSKPFLNQFKHANFIAEQSKSARFGGGPKIMRVGDIPFCGDAANINFKPLIEGILPAIIAGNAAGIFFAENRDIQSYSHYIESNLPQWNENIKLNEIMGKLFEKNIDNSLSLFTLCSGLLNMKSILEFSNRKIDEQIELCKLLMQSK